MTQYTTEPCPSPLSQPHELQDTVDAINTPLPAPEAPIEGADALASTDSEEEESALQEASIYTSPLPTSDGDRGDCDDKDFPAGSPQNPRKLIARRMPRRQAALLAESNDPTDDETLSELGPPPITATESSASSHYGDAPSQADVSKDVSTAIEEQKQPGSPCSHSQVETRPAHPGSPKTQDDACDKDQAVDAEENAVQRHVGQEQDNCRLAQPVGSTDDNMKETLMHSTLELPTLVEDVDVSNVGTAGSSCASDKASSGDAKSEAGEPTKTLGHEGSESLAPQDEQQALGKTDLLDTADHAAAEEVNAVKVTEDCPGKEGDEAAVSPSPLAFILSDSGLDVPLLAAEVAQDFKVAAVAQSAQDNETATPIGRTVAGGTVDSFEEGEVTQTTAIASESSFERAKEPATPPSPSMATANESWAEVVSADIAETKSGLAEAPLRHSGVFLEKPLITSSSQLDDATTQRDAIGHRGVQDNRGGGALTNIIAGERGRGRGRGGRGRGRARGRGGQLGHDSRSGRGAGSIEPPEETTQTPSNASQPTQLSHGHCSLKDEESAIRQTEAQSATKPRTISLVAQRPQRGGRNRVSGEQMETASRGRGLVPRGRSRVPPSFHFEGASAAPSAEVASDQQPQASPRSAKQALLEDVSPGMSLQPAGMITAAAPHSPPPHEPDIVVNLPVRSTLVTPIVDANAQVRDAEDYHQHLHIVPVPSVLPAGLAIDARGLVWDLIKAEQGKIKPLGIWSSPTIQRIIIESIPILHQSQRNIVQAEAPSPKQSLVARSAELPLQPAQSRQHPRSPGPARRYPETESRIDNYTTINDDDESPVCSAPAAAGDVAPWSRRPTSEVSPEERHQNSAPLPPAAAPVDHQSPPADTSADKSPSREVEARSARSGTPGVRNRAPAEHPQPPLPAITVERAATVYETSAISKASGVLDHGEKMPNSQNAHHPAQQTSRGLPVRPLNSWNASQLQAHIIASQFAANASHPHPRESHMSMGVDQRSVWPLETERRGQQMFARTYGSFNGQQDHARSHHQRQGHIPHGQLLNQHQMHQQQQQHDLQWW